jgi:F-type H+-transporting ATPase subunit delta
MANTAARRYAKGLLGIALESGQSDALLSELDGLAKTLSGSAELRQFVGSPIIKNDMKRRVLGEVFPKASLVLRSMFDLLMTRGRLSLLGSIAAAFQELHNAHHGIVDAVVTSAYELGAVDLESLRQALEHKTGKMVRVHAAVDADLLGGVTVRVGDTVHDGSVRHSLEKLDGLLHVPTV